MSGGPMRDEPWCFVECHREFDSAEACYLEGVDVAHFLIFRSAVVGGALPGMSTE
jgi:hypothetical protein